MELIHAISCDEAGKPVVAAEFGNEGRGTIAWKFWEQGAGSRTATAYNDTGNAEPPFDAEEPDGLVAESVRANFPAGTMKRGLRTALEYSGPSGTGLAAWVQDAELPLFLNFLKNRYGTLARAAAARDVLVLNREHTQPYAIPGELHYEYFLAWRMGSLGETRAEARAKFIESVNAFDQLLLAGLRTFAPGCLFGCYGNRPKQGGHLLNDSTGAELDADTGLTKAESLKRQNDVELAGIFGPGGWDIFVMEGYVNEAVPVPNSVMPGEGQTYQKFSVDYYWRSFNEARRMAERWGKPFEVWVQPSIAFGSTEDTKGWLPVTPPDWDPDFPVQGDVDAGKEGKYVGMRAPEIAQRVIIDCAVAAGASAIRLWGNVRRNQTPGAEEDLDYADEALSGIKTLYRLLPAAQAKSRRAPARTAVEYPKL